MMKHLPLALLVSCLFAAHSVAAQTALLPQTEIERQARDLVVRNYPAEGPGAAVLVARGGTVLLRAARGEADTSAHVLLQPESVFRIGSVTKQFTAAGLLKLVEVGKVALEDPLSKYVPDLPGGDGISVLQLLNHTAGVRNYTSLPGYMNGPIRQDLTTEQMVDLFEGQPPDFEPGSQWSYSNSGYVLLGAVIEAASGQDWHAWLDQSLLEPLGLAHTGYGHDPGFAARQVQGYSYRDSQVVPMLPLSMTQPHGAGALVSNVDDLFAWNRALHEGQVLGDATYSQMITPVGEAADPSIGYGFGLFHDTVRGHDVLFHGGGIFGFNSYLSYLPGPDISVVILENNDGGSGLVDADTLARRLMAIALGDPYPALQAVPVDAAALQAAEGVYRFEADITRVLRVVDGRLTSQRGTQPPSPLTPIASDVFLFEDGFNRLEFERDASGRVSGARFFARGDGPSAVGKRTDEPLPSQPVAVPLPRAALERLVGTYARGGLTLVVFLDGETLMARLDDQEPVTLRATSPTRFDVVETGALLMFPEGDDLAESVTMRQGDRQIELKRAP